MTTPCDEPTEEWDDELKQFVIRHHCPYAETYTGYESEMCRVCCGLGVDE